MKTYILSIAVMLCANTAHLFSQEHLLVNAYNRASFSLNGEWKYIVDPYETGFYSFHSVQYDKSDYPGVAAYYTNSKPKTKSDLIEYDFDLSDSIRVPGDWNSQKEKLFYYEGTVWYKKSFGYAKTQITNRVFVYFDAVNYQADVYLNGRKLGVHIGGFTPFNFEVTDLLKAKDNFLIVKVDNNRKREGIPALNTDWWNYGGITRDVKLIETPAQIIQDYSIQLDPNNTSRLRGFVKLNGSKVRETTVRINILELALNKDIVTDTSGFAHVQFAVHKIKYWSNNNPHLYAVSLRTPEDEIVDHIGFRSIKASGENILLNGKKIYLEGICIHEENAIRGGRAYSFEDAQQLLTWAKELGCNYVRLAHYPHNEHMVRLADKMGILVWEENPVYWTILFENEATYQNAENQLTEVITRDKNRASVIIWSMANETPLSKARNRFLSRLAAKTRQLDPTRLISAALLQNNFNGNSNIKTIDDPMADVVDVISFNQYLGWYDGLPKNCRDVTWKFLQNKPVLMSEFGGSAKQGFHADSLTRFSEEYQEYLYRETLEMIKRIPQLQGFSPWILVDFRSPRRNLPGMQDGWNRKGLISSDGVKKKAYYVLKNYYDELSFKK